MKRIGEDKGICSVFFIFQGAFFSCSGGDRYAVTLLHAAYGLAINKYLIAVYQNSRCLIADIRSHCIGYGLALGDYIGRPVLLRCFCIIVVRSFRCKNLSAVIQLAAPVTFTGGLNLTVGARAVGIAIPDLLTVEHQGVHALS